MRGVHGDADVLLLAHDQLRGFVLVVAEFEAGV